METPYLPQLLFRDDFQKVYEPAEDTFLLLDALEQDIDYLKENVLVCIECGSGSGTVITALSKSLQQHVQRLMFATDINLDACKTTFKCLKHHKQALSVNTIQSDLALPLVDRLRGQVDLLVFNPPYVPTTDDELSSPKCLAWAGGEDGRSVTDRFLKMVPLLMSKPNGRAYLVALDRNRVNQLLSFLETCEIKGSVVISRRAGIENLSIIRYEWISK